MPRRRFLQILTGVGAFLGGLLRPLVAGGQIAPTVTAEPDTLTLPPGGSAQVTVTVDPASAYGTGSVTITVEVPEPYDGTIAGDFAGTVPAGEHWHITGDVNLTGDLIVEGLLTGVSAFTLTGNGFQILVQNGGQLDLAGVPKTAWLRWGDTPVGWQAGDRLAAAPTAAGVYVPSETAWGGSWSSTVRPGSSPDVLLVDGSTARPEVANLSQTIVLRNLRRVHFHIGAGVQSLRWVKVLDCGTAGVLGDYPIHFHLNGEASRGSVLEDVVVEGGRNHAFVPHGSHGITFPGCVAYNSKGFPFWWDPPILGQTPTHTGNDSNDIAWVRCLVLGVSANAGDPGNVRLAGFFLGAGLNLSCVGSVAVGVVGNANSGSRSRSGFHWPENASRTAWDFRNCVAHNNAENGVMTWQNTDEPHFVEDSTFYRNGYAGINHGAYVNQYRYSRLVLDGGQWSVVQHAKTREGQPATLTFEDLTVDRPLMVPTHNSQSMAASVHRRCTYPQVVYREGTRGSYNRYEDCGLTPMLFDLSGVSPSSIIEVWEGGVLMHRWQAGVWS